jgi:hypothetical protein
MFGEEDGEFRAMRERETAALRQLLQSLGE